MLSIDKGTIAGQRYHELKLLGTRKYIEISVEKEILYKAIKLDNFVAGIPKK